jgi:MFS family permease
VRKSLTVWGAWLVLMAGANIATPLYAVYAQRFGFSSLVLTSIFATYAFVLVPALILFGRLSDRLGRRPVIVAGLAVAAAALVLFALATGTAWLYGARALQGLAVGMIGGAATAALVELDPRRDRRRAALLAGLAQAGGSAAGPLAAGVLAEWAPDPLRLCFYVALGATVVAAVGTLTLAEPERRREPWRIEWPRVPSELRGPFTRVGLTAAIVWAAVALYLSIVPSYAGGLLGTKNLALLATLATVALLASCATQVVSQRRPGSPSRDQALGLCALAIGLVALVLAAPLHSLALLLGGAMAAGAGHGLGFLAAQQELNELAPDERRGEVTAAFIACIYFLVASAVIATGLFDLAFSLQVSVAVVAAALAAVALATAAWQAGVALPGWEISPASAPPSQHSPPGSPPSRSLRSFFTTRPVRRERRRRPGHRPHQRARPRR